MTKQDRDRACGDGLYLFEKGEGMGLPSYYFGLNSGVMTGIQNQSLSGRLPMVSKTTESEKYSVSFAVEGVHKEDIAVVIRNGQLIVELEKEYDPSKVAHSNWDKSYGIFTRYIDLPEDVDASALKTSVAEGVLTVEISRLSSAKKSSKSAGKKPSVAPEASL